MGRATQGGRGGNSRGAEPDGRRRRQNRAAQKVKPAGGCGAHARPTPHFPTQAANIFLSFSSPSLLSLLPSLYLLFPLSLLSLLPSLSTFSLLPWFLFVYFFWSVSGEGLDGSAEAPRLPSPSLALFLLVLPFLPSSSSSPRRCFFFLWARGWTEREGSY